MGRTMLLLGIGTVLLFSFCPSAKAQQLVELQDPVSTKAVTVPEEHSATKALLWSILPGGGQVYNGQAWKIPIIYGALAGVGYYAYYNYDRMVMFKDEYLYRVNNNDATNLADYASYPTSPTSSAISTTSALTTTSPSPSAPACSPPSPDGSPPWASPSRFEKKR